MKKVICSRLFFFILGAILFSGITVLAYTVNSNQVSYTPNNSNWQVDNVENAINDLYTTANSKMAIKLINDNYATSNSHAIFNTGNKYKYFKITGITQDDNVENCYARSWSIANNGYINLDIEKEYKIHDQEYNLATIEVVSRSKNSNVSRCTMSVELYN